MPSSGYTAITFVANEQPTTAKWNLIGSNDSSFNLGTGLEDAVILNRHLALANIAANKINFDTFSAAQTTGAQQSYTPANLVGYASTTLRIGYYFVIGKMVFLEYYITGTSNGGNVEFDLPVGLPAKNNNGLAVEANTGLIINNGSVVASGQRCYVDPATNAQKVVVQYGFTASGSKTVRGQFFYETT